ncbi:oligosaccharide flippase family protein [Lysinibacillus sp. MHQ-1]|nr:oligosaccharide flippase family protein [Lysinibacillus sp. MHQ-1]
MPLVALTIPYISTTLLHNEHTTFTLWIALFAVPVSVGSGLLRAYLQGIAKITPTAWSQMIEQVVRISFITLMLPYVANYNNAAVTAAAAMGITLAAEVVAFLYLWLHYIVSKKEINCAQNKNRRLSFIAHATYSSAFRRQQAFLVLSLGF